MKSIKAQEININRCLTTAFVLLILCNLVENSINER